jgi:hypothetical protein
MNRFDAGVLHQKGVEAFLSIPFEDIIAFGTCMALAIYWRKKPEYHRRLVFIATCALMDAAIGRFDFCFDHNLFYPALDLLIVLGMVRDWVVDGRVHKVYLYALPSFIVLQSIAVCAYRANALRVFGRGDWIRTSDPLRPRQVRYQAALRPDWARL